MKKFIGRVVEKIAFEESLAQFLTDAKKPSFLKKEKKKETKKILPKLFLFCGEGGLGKTTLLEEFIRTTEDKAKKYKEEIRIIKLDWDDCYNNLSILPNNVSSIIESIYATFSNTIKDPEKYFDQFLQLKRDTHKQKKESKEETTSKDVLSEALVRGISELSKSCPLIFAIDAYERVDNKNVELWFRSVFLKGILDSQGRIIIILSGRNNHIEPYRKQFPGGHLHHTHFDELLFTAAEIKSYTKACGLRFKDNDINKLLKFTRGIPMVIVEVCNLIIEGVTLNQVLGNLISQKHIKAIIQDMVKGFLKYCYPELGERVFNMAMQHRCNPEILSHAWEISEKRTMDYLSELSERHSFIHKGRLHPRVHEFLRHYIINELVTNKPNMFKKFGKKSRDFLAARMEEIEKKAATLEELYTNENYLVNILEYINALMWWDSKDAIEFINKNFLGLLEFKREVIPALNKMLFEFDPILSPGDKKNVDALVTGFLDYRFNGENLDRKPGKSEIELLSSLTAFKNSLTSKQVQLLYYKWGEIYFRSGEFEKALKILNLTSDIIQSSRSIRENVIYMYRVIGENYSRNKNYPLAFDSIDKALQLDPGNTDALCTRGNIFHTTGEYDKAMADYNKVLELNPLNAKAYKSRGNTYYAKQEYDKALQDYNRAIELGLLDAEAYLKRGSIYHSLREYDKVLADLSRALEINPEDEKTYYSRGNIYHARGEYEKALVDYSLSIELGLETSDVFLNRGRIYQVTGEYDAALTDYNRVIELNPRESKIYYYRGDVYHAKGEHRKALFDYERGIEINPEYGEACDELGISYNNKIEFEKELSECSQDIESDPEDASLYYNRGNVYDALGDYDKALADYDRAIELDPQDAEFFSSRGIVYHAKGEYKKALADYSWAIELDPEEASLHYNRGNTFDALKEYDKALEDYSRAIDLDPENADAFNNRGTIYYFKEKYKQALADYNRAIELDPESASSYYNRGNVYDALEEYHKALEDYNQAVKLDPEDPIAYILLTQLYIIKYDFPAALDKINKTLTLELDKDDKAFCLYFKYIAWKMLDKDTTECEKELKEILKEDFVSTWSLDEIESWLSRSKIPRDKKDAIIEKTNLLKKHKK